MALPPKKSPLEAFELLQKHREFHVALLHPATPKSKVLRYVVLVYDKNSPLHEAHTDLNKKKLAAAELSGFVKEPGGMYSEKVEEMFRCKDKDINPMIIRYITLSRSALYHKYTILNEFYTSVSVRMLAGEAKIDEFNKVNKELEICESELLSNDNNLHEDFTQYYFETNLELRPEDIAIRIQKGEKAIEINV